MTRSLTSIGVGVVFALFLVAPTLAGEPADFQPAKLEANSLRGLRYPTTAEVAGVGASVRLALTVDERGRVSKAVVVDCDRPNIGFEEAATEAARRWTFEPARLADEPVESTQVVRLGFNPRGRDASPADRGYRAAVAVLGSLPPYAAVKGDPGSLVLPAARGLPPPDTPEFTTAEFPHCSTSGEPCLYEKSAGGNSKVISLPDPLPPKPIGPSGGTSR